MGQERRSVPRITPIEIFYVQFGEDTGGIVWNVSESGLGFHAATPMSIAGPMRVRLSPNPENRIEINGTIAWIDKARRYGGLQFIGLTTRTRDLLRAWLAQSPISVSADADEEKAIREIGHEQVAVSAPPKLVQEVENRASRRQAESTDLVRPKRIPENVLPAVAQREMAAAIPRVSLPSPALLAEMSARGRALTDAGWLHVLVIALLICLVAAVPVAVFAPVRSGIGASLIRLGEKLTGRGQTQTDAPASMPEKNTVENASNRAPANPQHPEPTDSSVETAKPPQPGPSSPGTNAPAEQPADPEDGSRPPALNHHPPSQPATGVISPTLRSAVVDQLWAEVGFGNVSAEIALARLYLKGDGVPKSCEQARVLLGIAAKHGSLEATRQLQNLRIYGCR